MTPSNHYHHVDAAGTNTTIPNTETDPESLDPARPSDVWRTDEVFLDNFVVESVLGTGAMGEVYRVRNLITEKIYGVKRARLRGEGPRKKLLRELQVWLDLPVHPHLHRLHFIRTIGEDIALFTEYAAGGNLARWISGPRPREMPEVLRVALQLTSALAATHRANVVHQDIKPANILMTERGDVMLSDFGIARMVIATAGTAGEHKADYAGRTLAYCSPEQHEKKPLGPASDVWSLGLVLLELTVGQRTWLTGLTAEAALDGIAARIPAPLVEFLRRCFAREPSRRWCDGGALHRQLTALCNTMYPSQEASSARSEVQGFRSLSRKALGAIQTHAPRGSSVAINGTDRPTRAAISTHQLLRVQRALALSPSPSIPASSRGAQRAAILHEYDHAAILLSRHPSEDWRGSRALLLAEKAAIHLALDDIPGALRALEQSVVDGETHLATNIDDEVVTCWLAASTQRAMLLIKLRHSQEALDEIERVARLANTMPATRGHLPSAIELLNIKAIAHRTLGQLPRALEFYGRAFELSNRSIERLSDEAALPTQLREPAEAMRALIHTGREKIAMNMACILDDLQRHDESAELQFAVLSARRRKLGNERTPDHLRDVAISCFNLGLTRTHQNNRRGAHRMMIEAESAYKQLLKHDLVDRAGHGGADETVAMWLEYCGVLTSRGSLFADDGEFDQATAYFERAIPLFEEFVIGAGHQEYEDLLALKYKNYAEVLASAGNRAASEAMFARSATMYNKLTAARPSDASEHLAKLHLARARRLGASPDRQQHDYEKSIELLEEQVNEQGREDLLVTLLEAYLRRYDQEGRVNPRGEVWIDRSLRLLQRWPTQVPAHILVPLIEALARKGTLHYSRGEHVEAIEHYDRALALAANRNPQERVMNEALGIIMCNRARCLGLLGKRAECAQAYEATADSLDPLYNETRGKQTFVLLMTALTVGALGFMEEATLARSHALARRAIERFDAATAIERSSLEPGTGGMVTTLRQKLLEVSALQANRNGDMFASFAAAMPGHPVHDAVQALLFCFSWDDKRRLTWERWSSLAQDSTMIVFIMFGERMKTMAPAAATKLQAMLRLHLSLLNACKEQGIDVAFADDELRGSFLAAGLLR